MRRGDYKRSFARSGATLVGRDYFKRAVDMTTGNDANSSDTVIVVASDDPDWCQENLVGKSGAFAGRNAHLLRGKGHFFDFAFLASCNVSVMDYGSFGFWSAFLTPGPKYIATGYINSGVEPRMVAQVKNWTGFRVVQAITK